MFVPLKFKLSSIFNAQNIFVPPPYCQTDCYGPGGFYEIQLKNKQLNPMGRTTFRKGNANGFIGEKEKVMNLKLI